MNAKEIREKVAACMQRADNTVTRVREAADDLLHRLKDAEGARIVRVDRKMDRVLEELTIINRNSRSNP